MRVTVWSASEVWSVPKVRWPVSASVRAARMVVWSRISPISTTSGSSRSTRRSASSKLAVSLPTSRCETNAFRLRCRYSTGSSMVKMWQLRVRLISSMMLASVVDLPEPVAPVTSTSPFCMAQAERTICGGSPSSSSGKNSDGSRRSAQAI
ncbi:hypothetical protein SDC9_174154 [bioreactor metagenome]|uniref:Uncharacterized protein n=1 Tax=bioreactor metagenome TaxID=1076179 RepID=A0A645GLJ4_9ZZZZ